MCNKFIRIILHNEMAELNVFYNRAKVKNTVDLLSKVIDIYALLNSTEENKLAKYEKRILLYYLQKGFNETALEAICEDTGYKKNYLHVVNKKLRDKGYLIVDEKRHVFDLNADLKLMRKKFVDDKSKGYIINFGV